VTFSWQLEGLPPKDQLVLIAVRQPEELTGPECEPTPVWVGYWDGATWRSEQAEEVKVIAWMDFPIPPFVTHTSIVGGPKDETGPEFHVEPVRVKDIGTFYGVKCGSQLLAVRANKITAQALMQKLKEVAK